ncbi:MAG: hypothetical protein ABI175_13565 [Polyangiales bacterium]
MPRWCRTLAVVVLGGCGFTTPGSARAEDAAPPDLTSSLCGNLATDATEECDDGNTDTGDGCAACLIEPAWQCVGGQPCVHLAHLTLAPREALPSAGTSGGGGAFSHPCAAGAAIVGFDGRSSNGDTDIGMLRAACAVGTFADDGRITWSTVQSTPYQATQDSGDLGASRCATDSLVVGYIANAGQYLSGLQPLCAQVSFVHGALVIGTPVPLPVFGPATQQPVPAAQCAPGEATAAFEGKSGSVLDHFNLKCFALTAVP